MNELNIAVVSTEKHRLDDIKRTLQSASRRIQVTTMEYAPQRLGAIASQLSADILLVDCNGYDTDALSSLEQVSALHPQTPMIILSQCESPEFLIQAMRLGVREVLPSNVNGAALDVAIERIVVKSGRQNGKSGKVFAFASGKGGSGATFLATNLGYALAAESTTRVALFDFNLLFGDAVLFMSDQKVSSTVADVVQGIYRLDEAFLKANMMQIRPNFEILPAPEDPTLGIEIKPEHVDALIGLARHHYDYVILDVGRHLDALTIRALDHADTIFAVIQATLPSMRSTRRLLDIFHSLEYAPQKVELVVNRFEKDNALTIKDMETSCNAAIRRAIPHHAETAEAAMNQGIPVTKLASSSPIAKSLAAWVADLLGREPVEEVSWFNRLLRRA